MTLRIVMRSGSQVKVKNAGERSHKVPSGNAGSSSARPSGGRKSSAETFLLHLQHQLKPQSFEELKLKVKVMEFGYKTGPLVRQFLCRSETKFCERFFR
jgi:hypothetical protein